MVPNSWHSCPCVALRVGRVCDLLLIQKTAKVKRWHSHVMYVRLSHSAASPKKPTAVFWTVYERPTCWELWMGWRDWEPQSYNNKWLNPANNPWIRHGHFPRWEHRLDHTLIVVQWDSEAEDPSKLCETAYLQKLGGNICVVFICSVCGYLCSSRKRIQVILESCDLDLGNVWWYKVDDWRLGREASICAWCHCSAFPGILPGNVCVCALASLCHLDVVALLMGGRIIQVSWCQSHVTWLLTLVMLR